VNSEKYIGLDVHQATISVAVMDSRGKVVMESILETKATTILEFFAGLRGTLSVTFEEGTWAAWLYDLLKPHVAKLVVCNPRKNALLKHGNKSDRIDARKLADLLRLNDLEPVYHGETGVRMLRELARSYLTIVKDLSRVMNRLKALYRSWAIPCAGRDVYYTRHRNQWLGKIPEAGTRRRAEQLLYLSRRPAPQLRRPKSSEPRLDLYRDAQTVWCMFAKTTVHQRCLPVPSDPPERTSPAARTRVGQHARVRQGTTTKKESGSAVRGTKESDRIAPLALAKIEVCAGAVLLGSGGPEYQATSAVPQPTDNTGSASHHLAELREEKLGTGTCSREDIPFAGLFQHPRDLSPTQDTKQPYEPTSPSGPAITTT
jgi:hypothetical protein